MGISDLEFHYKRIFHLQQRYPQIVQLPSESADPLKQAADTPIQHDETREWPLPFGNATKIVEQVLFPFHLRRRL